MTDFNEVTLKREEVAWEKVQRRKLGMKEITNQAGSIRKSPELKTTFHEPL